MAEGEAQISESDFGHDLELYSEDIVSLTKKVT